MSDTSALLKNAKPTQSTQVKPTGSKSGDLELVAERLSLIQGHISQLPDICISGVRMLDGFLLVAVQIKGHSLSVVSGAWMIDGQDVTDFVSGGGAK